MKVKWIKSLLISGTKYLFNSQGDHIANLAGGNIFLPSGEQMGRYSYEFRIFVSVDGSYLGEILYEDRLLYNLFSSFRGVNFGGQFPVSIGNLGNPGNVGAIMLPPGYADLQFA